VPVPQADTGRLAEHAKATREPLLRNSANQPRNFGKRGALVAYTHSLWWRERVAANRPKRLFNKNTGLCKRESGRIGADACPVLEG
jgi:hypothetical protein